MHSWRFRTDISVSRVSKRGEQLKAHVFLLFVHMANLEPDVFFVERPWWISNNILETLQKRDVSEKPVTKARPTCLQALLKFLLLLVYYTESEVYLICLFEVGLHPHHLAESLFGMLKGAISIIEDANSVPKFRL